MVSSTEPKPTIFDLPFHPERVLASPLTKRTPAQAWKPREYTKKELKLQAAVAHAMKSVR